MIYMAVLFSAVTVSASGIETELLTSGIPRELEDLEGWTAFDNFMEDINDETEVTVHADAYLYGEGEIFKASPEEVAYMCKRCEDNPNFLKDRCQNIDKVDFSFTWSPDELFNMEVS